MTYTNVIILYETACEIQHLTNLLPNVVGAVEGYEVRVTKIPQRTRQLPLNIRIRISSLLTDGDTAVLAATAAVLACNHCECGLNLLLHHILEKMF